MNQASVTGEKPTAPAPSIAEQLLLLAELASVDQKAKVLSDKLEGAAGPARKLDDVATQLKKAVEDTQLKKTASELQKRAIESEIQEERIKIKKWEARASELRGEREHEALASEIGTAKRVIRQFEDRQLEHMEAVELATGQLEELTKKSTAATASAAAEWKKAGGDLQAMKEQVATFAAARAALLCKLPGPLVKRYEQVAGKRGGVGVSIIKGEMCGGCKTMLPPQLCIQVRKGIVLEACGSCSRFLVHETMTAVAQPLTGSA